jgi:formylglycine-generating enzyme required for sulfatase activity
VWGVLNKQPFVAAKIVRAMLEMTSESDKHAQNILLAGACLEDVGLEGLGRATANDVVDALERIAYDRNLSPPEQRDAGFGLGRIASSHPDFLARIRPDLDEFVLLPAAEFLYGDEKKPAKITKPFAIAKYPVTNLQYRRFIDAGGYDKQEYWSIEGWSWRIGKYITKANDDLESWLSKRPVEKRSKPFYWYDDKWNNPLAPAVGVSWFEAEAYANWLGKVLVKPMRLPTEQEWEYAARGTKGREYSWGNDFNFNYANSAEFWAQDNDIDWFKWTTQKGKNKETASTSFVGQFNGTTPEGISDLCGNVWEWTNSWYEEAQVTRTLRGGSRSRPHRSLRAAYRIGIVPDNFDNAFGFRLVSPNSVSGF